MNATDQIALIIKSLGTTQGRLAETLNINVQQLKDIQRGKVKNISGDICRRLVEYVHVNPEWLISGAGPVFRPHQQVNFEKKMAGLKKTTESFAIAEDETLGEAERDIIEAAQLCSVTNWADDESRAKAIASLTALRGAASDYQIVPKSSARPSAGYGSMVESEQIVDYMAFKRDWLQRVLGISHQDIVLVEVRGDSMAGTLEDGDLALVDMRQNRLDVSAVFVIQVDDALLVKRVQRKLDGTVVIRSDNAAYEPEVLVGAQLKDLRVVGRVVWPRLR